MSDHQHQEDDQLLRDSFTALREIHSGSKNKDRATATRRAILLQATKERKRRAIVIRLVLPLAAVLAVSTAWAAATGRLPAVYTTVLETLHLTPTREPTASGPTARSTPTPTPTPTTTPTTTSTATEPPITASATSDPTAPTSPASSSSVAITTPPPPTSLAPASPTTPTRTVTPSSTPSAKPAIVAAADREESLYKAAHEAHFVMRDSQRALTAWDAYLAAYPQGRFAPEARYNRALSLVRLNRRDEAKNALRPFAEGKEVGGYRQREAKDLLDAMGD